MNARKGNEDDVLEYVSKDRKDTQTSQSQSFRKAGPSNMSGTNSLLMKSRTMSLFSARRALVQSPARAASAAGSTVGGGSHRRGFASSEEGPPPIATALYDWHKERGGDLVSFAGYSLPVLYKGENGGVMKEHLWCRSEGHAALFDVSHMGQVRLL
jgi:Aminomethyltransferase folate-binding domain